MRLPPGFLGTRADVLMDVILVAMSLTPFVLLWAIRLARRRNFVAHRNLQTALLGVLLVAVVLFEVDVRTSGADAFLKGSPHLGTAFFTGFLRVHIAVAVTAFAWWTYVVFRAWRVPLAPGSADFGPAHKRAGWAIFAGVTFTSISGAALYWMSFVS